MIRLVILLLIFFTVMALSPFLIDEKGYILIAMGDLTIESTVLSAIIMLTLGFIVLLFSLKLLRGSVNFSFGAWRTIAFAGQRRGIANFNKGLAAYVLEDYAQAEQLFSKSASPSKRKQSAYLLAAAASEKQGLETNTTHYLNLLEQETSKLKEVGLESVIVKVKLLLNQKKDEANSKARALIDEHHKFIGHDVRLLTLEIDLCLAEKRFDAAITNLKTARKQKSISLEQIHTWESTAYYGLFNQCLTEHDAEQLASNWQQISRKLKQQESILFAYCQVLAEHNAIKPLNNVLLPLLKKSPSADVLKQIRMFPFKQADDLIAVAQKQLHKNIHSGKWLSCLGHLALHSAQYAMSEKAFRSLVKLESDNYGVQYDKLDLAAFAQALSAQEQHQSANEVWLKASKL